MHELYTVTKHVADGGWLRVTAVSPRVPVQSTLVRGRLAAAKALLEHATGDSLIPVALVALAPGLVDDWLEHIPGGAIPVVVNRADLLAWAVRRLAKEMA